MFNNYKFDIPTKDIAIPEFPEAFKNKELEVFIKGLLKSKYYIFQVNF